MRALILVGLAIAAGCAPRMTCRDTSGVNAEGQYTMVEVCVSTQCRDLKTGKFMRCR